MSKMFKCMCLLVMSVFCMSSISPSLVVFADDSLSTNSKVVSGQAQFENGSSVRFGDTQVNILSDEVLEVVNPDGVQTLLNDVLTASISMGHFIWLIKRMKST